MTFWSCYCTTQNTKKDPWGSGESWYRVKPPNVNAVKCNAGNISRCCCHAGERSPLTFMIAPVESLDRIVF
jgi:hypothetical protein